MDATCPILENGTHAMSWIYVSKHRNKSTKLPLYLNSYFLIQSIFGDCVYTWQEGTSLLFGYLSIFCWLNAQLP